MSTYTVQPHTQVLWCLRRRASDVRCVLFPRTAPVEVHVFQDLDLVLKEVFDDESLALSWANAYGDRLRQHGWRESPQDCSPSSAA